MGDAKRATWEYAILRHLVIEADPVWVHKVTLTAADNETIFEEEGPDVSRLTALNKAGLLGWEVVGVNSLNGILQGSTVKVRGWDGNFAWPYIVDFFLKRELD